MEKSVCSIEDCGKISTCRGLCPKHYQRLRLHGTTDLISTPLEERFWDKVDKSGDCWLWMDVCKNNGYGTISISNSRKYAHRIAYELLVGPVPKDHDLDHRPTCPKNCVNPNHLRPTTQKQNSENLSGPHCDSKTRVRGVVWDKSRNKYRVSVGHNYKHYYGGRFSTLAEAEAAAIALRSRLFTHNDLDREAV